MSVSEVLALPPDIIVMVWTDKQFYKPGEEGVLHSGV
jgi:hypothetical protein